MAADEIQPQYGFNPPRPNKDAARYAKGSIFVTIDPDVGVVFPSAGKANEALRALAGIIRKHLPRQEQSRRSA